MVKMFWFVRKKAYHHSNNGHYGLYHITAYEPCIYASYIGYMCHKAGKKLLIHLHYYFIFQSLGTDHSWGYSYSAYNWTSAAPCDQNFNWALKVTLHATLATCRGITHSSILDLNLTAASPELLLSCPVCTLRTKIRQIWCCCLNLCKGITETSVRCDIFHCTVVCELNLHFQHQK